MGVAPGHAAVASEPAVPAMGLQTMGRMPEELEAPEGQGHPARSGSGIPPALAPMAATPATGVPPVEAAPRRTEAPVPEQAAPAHSSQPASAQAPPFGTQSSSQQTQGQLPHVPRDEADQDQPSTPDLSQGQLFLDHEEGGDMRDVRNDMGGADSPRYEAESPLAPSGVPDEQASHQLETPPPTVQRMDQGQQTTPEKTRMPRRQRAQIDPVRLPRDGEVKLVPVDMDEVRSCNQAEGRPKRKQMRVLRGWQNERVVYERVPGSACPTICKVMVAQPVVNDQYQEAIPLELHLGEDALRYEASPMKDKALSPLPSNGSDYTYMFGQSEEEKVSTFGEDPTDPTDPMEPMEPELPEPEELPERGSKRAKTAPKTAKSRRSSRRHVEMAAEVGTAAAAATFEATPPRPRPSHTANGFVRVPIADGSTDACELRVGLDNGNWMSCDINIPPRSFNTPEQLAETRSLLIYVMHCQDGTFDAQVDQDIVTLATGSSMVIRPGQEYCLRNGSDHVVAELKMTMINLSRQ